MPKIQIFLLKESVGAKAPNPSVLLVKGLEILEIFVAESVVSLIES